MPPQKPVGFVPDGFEPDPPPQTAAPRQPFSAEQFMTPEDIANRDMTGWDIAKGFAKGAGRSLASTIDMIGQSRVLPGVNPAAVSAAVQRFTPEYTNDAQRLGGLMETVAEVVPGAIGSARAVAQAIPNAARAGRAFQSVMSAAKTVPINTEAPGQVGLRIMQIAERGGGSMPRPVSQLLQRITSPDKAPLAYEEARDFASGISRLSANEMQRLSPVMAREVAELRVTLNKAVAEAAGQAGKGAEYAAAMNEYAKAMKLRGMIDDVITGAKRAAPWAAAAGAGTWLTSKMLNLLGGK